MKSKYLKMIMAFALIVAVWVTVITLDRVLQSTSHTYDEIAEEIDERSIDTGNAMNFFGDEVSADAVYEATQTIEHPPGKGMK